MQLIYELTLADSAAAVDHRMRHSPVMRHVVARQQATIAGLGVGLTALGLWGGAPWWMALMATSIYVALMAGLAPSLIRRNSTRINQQIAASVRNGTLIGPCRVTIAPDGIVESVENLETKIRWAGVEQIDVTPTHVFVWANAARLIVIPRRAFSDERVLDEFVDRARGLQRAALGPSNIAVAALPGSEPSSER